MSVLILYVVGLVIGLMAFGKPFRRLKTFLRWSIRRRILKLRLAGERSHHINHILGKKPPWDVQLYAFLFGQSSLEVISRYAASSSLKRRAEHILATQVKEEQIPRAG